VTRSEAAALLGVEPGASAAEVRRAFRERVRTEHPDGLAQKGLPHVSPDGGAQVGDLARLTEARDVLLAPTGQAPPTRSAKPAPATTQPRPPEQVARSSSSSAAWLAVATGLFGLIVFGLVAITIVALLAGPESDGIPAGEDECVVVLDDTVATAACSEPRAQRIDSTFTGGGSCPAGTNTLVVSNPDGSDTTWCLRPAG